MRYQLAKTAVNNPAIDSPEWEKAPVAEIADSGWAGYAKAPRITFQILRTPEGIAVRFHTEETHLRAEVTEENAGILFEKMKAIVPDAECNLLYGGQPLYDFVISVE